MVNKILTLFLFIISCILSIILAEGILRAIYPQPLYSFDRGLFTQSPDYGYCLTPKIEKNHRQPEYIYRIKSNTEGFRGRNPDSLSKNRILVLGDSCGMGQGVAEGKNLCDISQSYFDAQKRSLNIFNTSVSGYAGINEFGVLKKQLPLYKPDIAILLFNWNDLGITRSLMVQNGYLVLSQGGTRTTQVREWLNNHSHLYSLIKRTWYSYSKPDLILSNAKIPRSDIDIALQYIYDMKALCGQYGTKFAVVLLPFGGVSAGGTTNVECRDIMIQELVSHGIRHEDWTQILSKDDSEKYFFKRDRHWNEAGHKYFSLNLSRLISDMIQKDP